MLKLLAKSFLTPLGLAAAAAATVTATASTTDAAIYKKNFGSGIHPSSLAKQTTLTISD